MKPTPPTGSSSPQPTAAKPAQAPAQAAQTQPTEIPLVEIQGQDGQLHKVPEGFFAPKAPDGYTPGVGVGEGHLGAYAGMIGRIPKEIDTSYVGDARQSLFDPEVLCTRCIHGQVMKAAAAVANLRQDGSRFVNEGGRCLISPSAPLDLVDFRPTECSTFQAKP